MPIKETPLREARAQYIKMYKALRKTQRMLTSVNAHLKEAYAYSCEDSSTETEIEEEIHSAGENLQLIANSLASVSMPVIAILETPKSEALRGECAPL